MLRRVDLISLVLAASALAVPSVAQVDLKRALPESTILYMGAPDLDKSIAEMQDMPLLHMWREESVQDFFADALQMAESQWNQVLAQAKAAHEQGQLPFDPDELLGLRVHGAAVALTAMDFRQNGDETYPHISAIAQLDFGDTAPAWRKVIEFMVQMVEQQSQGMLQKETSEVAGASVITLVPPETDMTLNIAFKGAGVLIGTDRDTVKQVLENLASDANVLTSSANYLATFKHVRSQGAELESYVQFAPIWDFMTTALATAAVQSGKSSPVDFEGVGRALDALGLRSIHSVGVATSYVPRPGMEHASKAVTESFVLAPYQTRKGLFAHQDKALDMGFLRWVPKDAASFTGCTFDLASIYDALVGALHAYDEEFAKGLMDQMAKAEEAAGVRVKQDLIDAIGDELVYWSMPLATGGLPELAVLVRVKSEKKVLNSLKAIAKMTQGKVEITESERQGLKRYAIQFNTGGGGGMGFNPLAAVTPTFSFKNGFLVGGLSTNDVKRAFKRMDAGTEGESDDDIRSNAQFKPYLDGIPKEGITSISFSDWKAEFEGLYNTLTPVLAMIPMGEDLPIDLSLLPETTTLTQHLFGSVSWQQADKDGLRGMDQGPWGPETAGLIAGCVGVGAGVLAWSNQSKFNPGRGHGKSK
jgi:hypothetical protein